MDKRTFILYHIISMTEWIIKLLNYAKEWVSPITPVLKDNTIRLTENQMMELYGKWSSTINEHINNIYEEEELKQGETSQKINSSGNSGKSGRPPTYYNLDIILAVWYRVKSPQGIAFRNRSSSILKEYTMKWFIFNDKHLQQTEKLEAMLERVREIRFSESNLYSKIKDLIAYSSFDYAELKSTKQAQQFFAILQNKFLFAITWLTAREIIMERLNHSKPAWWLQTLTGNYLTKTNVWTGKNYLNKEELKQLYLLCEQFFSFAELQISLGKQISLVKWYDKLQEVLDMNELPTLTDQNYKAIDKQTVEDYIEAQLTLYQQKRWSLQTFIESWRHLED